jgi:hypothetical protein
MALKEQLIEEEKKCVEVSDYVDLAKKALEEPTDLNYAKELLETAEEECKFPDDYVLIAEIYAKINEIEKARELYETAEENAFEALEFGRIAHSIFRNLNDKEKSLELYQNALKNSKKLPELALILSYIQQDFPVSPILTEVTARISSQIKNIEDLRKILNELPKENKFLAVQICKEFEKSADGIDNISQLACFVYEYFSDADWAANLLSEISDEAKFTKEFITLARTYRKIGKDDEVEDLLSQAKDFAVTVDETYELALAIWELKKDKNSTSELLKKSYKGIKNKNLLKNLLIFTKEELENIDLTKEIINFLVESASSNDDLLKTIVLGYEILQDSSLSVNQLDFALNKLSDPKELISFATEIINKIGEKEKAKDFFNKAFDNVSKFEQLVDLVNKHFQFYSDKEFVAKALQKSESLSTSTSEFIEIAKQYIEKLNDYQNGRRCLETAEEIVASLHDIKMVVESVKNYFAAEENWINRVEEKLKKREANQSKYDEFLKLEKDAKYLKDYLSLVDKVINELDDIYYAKKLLNKAKELLDNQYLNIENYYKLCKSILTYCKDNNWAIEIFDELYSRRIIFINELQQLVQFLNSLPFDKELIRSATEKYLNGWLRKVRNCHDALKLANLLLMYDFPEKQIENTLEKCMNEQKDFLTMYEILRFALENGLQSLKNKILDTIFSITPNASHLIDLLLLLKKHSYSSKLISEKMIEYAKRTNEINELILLAENATKLLPKEDLKNFFEVLYKKVDKDNEILEKIHSIIVEEKYW